MADTDTAATFARLAHEAAIRDVITRYCLATDVGDSAAMEDLFTGDCEIDLDGALKMKGVAQVRGSMESDAFKAMLPKVAHVPGPFVVHVEGDRAVATGYLTLFMSGNGITPARQSLGRWEMVRQDGRWRISRRIVRSIGHAELPQYSKSWNKLG